MMTDQELIEGIIRKERLAFRFLVDKYQRQVTATAFHFLGNMDDAEDLAQEIFIEIIKAMPGFRQASRLDTWIYRITVNRSLNVIKSRKRREFIVRIENLFSKTSQLREIEPAKDETSHKQEEKENSGLLHQALQKIPENQRIAFVLHKLEDQSHTQVAEIMNLSTGAVESLIHRARINLRKTLTPHFPEFNK